MRASEMLTAGALLAVLARPVAADECSNYRAAVVLAEAAARVLDHAAGHVSLSDLLSGNGPHVPSAYVEASDGTASAPFSAASTTKPRPPPLMRSTRCDFPSHSQSSAKSTGLVRVQG